MPAMYQREPPAHSPEAFHRVFRPMHGPAPLAKDRSTTTGGFAGEVQQPEPRGSVSAPSSPSSADRWNAIAPWHCTSVGSMDVPAGLPSIITEAGHNRRRRQTPTDCSLPGSPSEGEHPRPPSPRGSPGKPPLRSLLHNKLLGRRTSSGSIGSSSHPNSLVDVVDEGTLDSPRLPRSDSLTKEWLAAAGSPRAIKRRILAEQAPDSPSGNSRLGIEFPTLAEQPARMASPDRVPIFDPELRALNLNPTSRGETAQSSSSSRRRLSTENSDSEGEYESSIDMPCDISLNNTMGYDANLAETLSGLLNRSSVLSNDTGEAADRLPAGCPADASPLAREPPLVKLTLPWSSEAVASTGVADRLHRVHTVGTGDQLLQRVRALEDENMRLRQQVAALRGDASPLES
mmetsp:Transcript_7760/g.22094  ORF Transcript_7760/g.22094 Transcript_7760/m.22094 type:complete len:402 (-) Transcript_7760:500-1705(-)